MLFNHWCYLFIPHIIRAGGGRFLHCNQTEHLEEMVLHDISIRHKTKELGSGQAKALVK